jgi:hypothetical protein
MAAQDGGLASSPADQIAGQAGIFVRSGSLGTVGTGADRES